MMRPIDAVIDHITMYRLLLYILFVEIFVGVVFAFTHDLAFSPGALLISTVFLVVMCWTSNTILGAIFNVPTNVESSILTALILALIFDPPKTTSDLIVLGWAAILAMSSKYILALHNKHLFNPAAISAVFIGYALQDPASWWVGTSRMLPVVLIGGLLIVRKVRQETMVGAFLLTAVVGEGAFALLHGTTLSLELRRFLVESPLFFFASIMLTEPLTAPPTKTLKSIYGLITGILFIPQVHLGSTYSTPELALVIGNVFSYLVSPKRKFVLALQRKTRLTPDTVDFAFTAPNGLAFAPGQYMEWTLGYPRADSRGNRRYFTLASSPTESVMHLGVKFYDEGSSFKKALLGLNRRSTILAGQIAGDFTLPANPREKLVFIAGGIGITPFRSMLKYLIDTRQQRDVVLFYAVRRVEEIAYVDVLDEANRRLAIPTYYTLTDADAAPRNWAGCVGRVDAEMIANAVPDYRERVFYLSGPPTMVRSYDRMLRRMGVGRRQIKKDFFSGLA